MSFWIVRRDATGRRHIKSVSVPLFPIVAMLAVVLSCLVGVVAGLSVPAIIAWASLVIVGLAMFVVAKLSVIRRGVLVSFGSQRMSPTMRRLYRLGWVLMLPGGIVTLLWTLVQLARSG